MISSLRKISPKLNEAVWQKPEQNTVTRRTRYVLEPKLVNSKSVAHKLLQQRPKFRVPAGQVTHAFKQFTWDKLQVQDRFVYHEKNNNVEELQAI